MICFVDESWHEAKKEEVGVLAGVLGEEHVFENLEKAMYAIKYKYYDKQYAKDLTQEFKGKKLFSNLSFKHRKKGYSKNLTIARELIRSARDCGIKIIGITVYGSRKPPLLSPLAKQLERPFKELCRRIISQIQRGEVGTLVFDQRIGAQQEISIAMYNYLAGITSTKKLRPHPFIGVSNIFSGLQLADVIAYILGKYATGDSRFDEWYRRLTPLQIEGKDYENKNIYGLIRLQWQGPTRFLVRKLRTKK
ncbi:DUF3800 domain-containing protein [Acidobacteria bacterium AH-259-G07]|nr:DUF3800 domain-containing protein [Acidobacteria bacterium AH-259-G07]